MQCVRESHREPEEEHCTKFEVTMLLKFSCYAILPRLHQRCCKKQNKQRCQNYEKPNVKRGFDWTQGRVFQVRIGASSFEVILAWPSRHSTTGTFPGTSGSRRISLILPHERIRSKIRLCHFSTLIDIVTENCNCLLQNTAAA